MKEPITITLPDKEKLREVLIELLAAVMTEDEIQDKAALTPIGGSGKAVN